MVTKISHKFSYKVLYENFQKGVGLGNLAGDLTKLCF